MQRRRFWIVVVGLIVALGVPLEAPADERLELCVIVHPDNRAAVSAALLEDIFLRRLTQWPGGDRVIPLNAPPDSDRREVFDRAVLRMSPDEVARYWLDQRIRGAGTAPREVAEPALTVKLVAKLKAAVGYAPAHGELGGVRIVARVRDGRLILP